MNHSQSIKCKSIYMAAGGQQRQNRGDGIPNGDLGLVNGFSQPGRKCRQIFWYELDSGTLLDGDKDVKDGKIKIKRRKAAQLIRGAYFKIGCYIILVLSIAILIYFYMKTRKKTKEALQKKEISAEGHPMSTAIFIIFFISLSFGVMANVLDWNEPGNITVLNNGKVIIL